jgi:alpha-tubulin suppressor-like RCC1 family protein
MNRPSLSALAHLTVILSTVLAGNAEADCNPPATVSGETVVWEWGHDVGDPANNFLPPGVISKRLSPVRLPITGVMAVAAGEGHSLALKSDGTVWAWGGNFFGQLGDGTNTTRYWDNPAAVYGLAFIKRVTAGDSHSLALFGDVGFVFAWGNNSNGQLGDGTSDNQKIPVQVFKLRDVTAVAAGSVHSLALKSDGTVWAWGDNTRGQLGNPTSVNGSLTPVQVVNLSGVTCIAAGGTHSLALTSDGKVLAWGENQYGQLGNGMTTYDSPTPVPVQNLTDIIAVAAADFFSLALKNDGTVWGWGENDGGQLGDGTVMNHDTPVEVKDLSGIIGIAAGNGHNLVLTTIGPPFDGVVQAWGNNADGELGDGSTGGSRSPVSVPAAALNEVTAIAVGEVHSLALATLRPYLDVRNILVHPYTRKRRLFNLLIDGVVVRANDNGGNTGFQLVSPGTHTVSETGGTGTPIGAFGVVIGGDCAADGTVNVAAGDKKLCTITNYDNEGGCPTTGPTRPICCEPGDGTQGCLVCSKPGQGCPGQ